MRVTARIAALPAALLVAGCARTLPGGVRCPADGGPPWREYRSSHFLVDTDLERPAAAALVSQMERFHALIVRAFAGGPAEVPGKIRVVAPASEAQYRDLAPLHILGYQKGVGYGETLVAFHPEAPGKAPQIVAHELAHALSWHFFLRQPRWFAEGIAQFVQTVAVDDARFGQAVGLVPHGPAGRISTAWAVRASALIAWTGASDPYEPDRHHFTSWLLYHWLWNQRPGQLADFQARLADGQDPGRSWAAAFPQFDPKAPDALDRLDGALDEHRRRGEFVYLKLEAQWDPSFVEVPLSSSHVHLLLLQAALSGARSGAMEVAEALREDPLCPWAVALEKHPDRESRIADLRRALAARPGDWRGWIELAWGLGEPKDDAVRAEKEAALRRALELNPDSPAANNELGWLLATSGRGRQALPFANRAVDLQPGRAAYVDTLALVAFRLGKCPEALVLQERALRLAGMDSETYSRRLEEYRSACRARDPLGP